MKNMDHIHMANATSSLTNEKYGMTPPFKAQP